MSKEMAKKHTLDNFFPNVEIKDYSVMIDGKNVFDQPIRDEEHMMILEKLPMVKEMITQVVVYYIISI